MKLVPEDAEEGAHGVAGPACSAGAAATQHRATGVSDSACAGADWVPGEAFAGPHAFLPDKEVRHYPPAGNQTQRVCLCYRRCSLAPTRSVQHCVGRSHAGQHCLYMSRYRSNCVSNVTAGASAAYALPRPPAARVTCCLCRPHRRWRSGASPWQQSRASSPNSRFGSGSRKVRKALTCPSSSALPCHLLLYWRFAIVYKQVLRNRRPSCVLAPDKRALSRLAN